MIVQGLVETGSIKEAVKKEVTPGCRPATGKLLSIIAEGIENDLERKLVERIGCRDGQGYLFAKPMHAEDLTAWIANNPGQ